MKIISKRIKYENNGIYYSFNLIEVCFINTFQVISLNITLLNFFIQILYEKRKKIIAAKSCFMVIAAVIAKII